MAFDRKAYMAEYNRRKYEENKQYWQRRYQDNTEEHKAKCAEWASSNRAARNAISQKWRDANRSVFADSCKQCKAKNHSRVIANNSARRAAKLQRTAAWINKDAVDAIYAEAHRLTKETGIKHHVDHIIPLRGRLVSGLHTHHNLRVVTAAENLKKSNRLELIE